MNLAAPLPGPIDLVVPSATLLDAGLRGALLATLLIVAAALARERPSTAILRVALALLMGLVVQTLASAPALERGLPILWQAPLVGLSVANSALFWLFARSLFDDEFALRRRHAALWAAVVAVGASYCVSLGLAGREAPITNLLRILLRWLPACFALLVIGAAIWRWRGDLVERRRRVRGFIVVAGSAYTGAIVLLRLAAPHGMLSPTAAGFDTAALLAIVFVSAVALLRLTDDAGLLGSAAGLDAGAAAGPPSNAAAALVPAAPPASSAVAEGAVAKGAVPKGAVAQDAVAQDAMPEGAVPKGAAPAPRFVARREAPIDAKQERLAEALDRLMREERVYRIDDLTLGLLALKLGVPEYRLRRCIHERLGYRNFNAYVNALRLAQARAELADPGRRSASVTEIAMAAGFASLGPFNRAFKAASGLTPSEFRLRALADS